MRGRKNYDKPPTTNILPPCRVCGEPGTGFHYGVTTCGACKGFFRRSLTREEPYECIRSQLCHVGPSTNRRKSCPKCRYEKCLAVGMCKEACKVGRYSRAKKTKDIKEAMEENTQPRSPAPVNPNGDDKTDWMESDSDTPPPTSDSYLDLKGDYSQGTPNGITFLNNRHESISADDDDDDIEFRENDKPYSARRGDRILDAYNHNHHHDLIDERHMMYGSERGTNGFGDTNSFFSNHPIARTIGDAARCVDNAISDNENCSLNSMPQSHNDGHNSTSPSYTTLKSPKATTSTSNNPLTERLTNNSVYFPSMGYKRNDNNDVNRNPLLGTLINTPPGNFQPPAHANPPNSLHHLSSHSSRRDIQQPIPPAHFNQHPHINIPSYTVLPQHSNKPPAIVHKVSPPHDEYTSPHNNHIINNINSVKTEQITTDSCQLNSELSHNGVSSLHYQSPTSNAPIVRSWDIYPKPPVHDRNIDPVSSTSKRLLKAVDEERTSTPKKQRLAETVEPDSSRQSDNLALSSKHETGEKTPPIKLYIVAPDPMKYVLSIFDRFPYFSFEKQSIAPLLKLCYDTNDWVEDYIPKIAVQNVPEPDPISTSTASPPSFEVILSSCNSPELPTSAHDMAYDMVEMDKLFDYVQTNHTQFYGSESSFLCASDAKRYLDMFHKICQLQDSLKGALDLVDDDKYYTILVSTGLDVDKRKAYFQCISQDFTKTFMRDAKFYRTLPGFKTLTLKDRVNLIKSTLIVIKALLISRSIDVDKDVYIDQERGRGLRISTYMRVSGLCHLIEGLNNILRHAEDLNMTFKEMVMLKAYFIMCPDFCGDLEDSQLIAKWNNIYLNCLLHHIRKTHGPHADERINKLFRLIQTIKSIRQPEQESKGKVKETMKHLIGEQKQSLMKEVFLD